MIWSLLRRKASPPSAAVLGKLPCRPDFVREGWHNPACEAFDRFLVQASPLLHESGGVQRLPELLVLQCLPKQTHGLLGVVTPSRDGAGREFPCGVLCGFERGARGVAPRDLGGLWWRRGAFIEAAQGLLERAPELDIDALRAELPELPCNEDEPGAGPAITSPEADAFRATLFGEQGELEACYALYAFASAFAAGQPGLSVMCPAPNELTARIWLELAAQAAARTDQCLCALYAPENAWLSIAISAWSPAQLCALVDPQYSHESVWPLSTPSVEAREQARDALLTSSPRLAQLRSFPVPELADALARCSLGLRA
jgi:hypothetical protein